MAEPAGDRRDLPWFPAVSPDGTKVAFSSDASNFGPADGNGGRDVYVRCLDDRSTGLVSARADGGGSGGSGNGQAELTVDTTDRSPTPVDRVVFRTLASDMGVTDTNGTWDVFLATPKAPSPKPPSP